MYTKAAAAAEKEEKRQNLLPPPEGFIFQNYPLCLLKLSHFIIYTRHLHQKCESKICRCAIQDTSIVAYSYLRPYIRHESNQLFPLRATNCSCLLIKRSNSKSLAFDDRSGGEREKDKKKEKR